MRKFLVTFIALALVMTFSAAGAAEFSGDMQLKAGEQGVPGKLYVKGKKQRSEMMAGGQEMISIVDMDGGMSYLLIPAMRVYLEAKPEGMTAQDWTQGPPKDAKKVGTESLQGYKCTVYEVKDKDGAVGRVWLSEKLGYPIKFQGKDQRGMTVVMEVVNIKEGPVGDDKFKLPAGYKPMDQNMMRGMQQGGAKQ